MAEGTGSEEGLHQRNAGSLVVKIVVSLRGVAVGCGCLVLAPGGITGSREGSWSTLSCVDAAAENIKNEERLCRRDAGLSDAKTNEGVGSRRSEAGSFNSLRVSAEIVDIFMLLVMVSGEALGVTKLG